MSSRSLSVLLHTWKLASIMMLLSVIPVVVVARWLGWWWTLPLIVYEIWIQVKWWRNIKKELVASLPEELDYEPMALEELPQDWDLKTLEENSQKLRNMGFQHIRDIRLAESCNNELTSFSRLFGHPQNFCFGELCLTEQSDQFSPLEMCSIHSTLTQGWSLSTTSIQICGLSYMWREPKVLCVCRPDTELADLLEDHLQRRQALVDYLHGQVVQDVSWELYVHQQAESAKHRREIFKGKNIVWALWEATWFELHKKQEWMGDAARFFPEHKRH